MDFGKDGGICWRKNGIFLAADRIMRAFSTRQLLSPWSQNEGLTCACHFALKTGSKWMIGHFCCMA